MRRSSIAILATLAVLLVVALLIWSFGPKRAPDLSTTQFAGPVSQQAIPARAASPPDDGNWTMPGKDYASTRFSALNQLTPANVGKLKVAFTFSTGTTEGFEAPPLVVNNTMYVVAPWLTMS